MFDIAMEQRNTRQAQMTSPSGMWQILAMDFAGFYGTRIVVAAPDHLEAVERATSEAERFARARLDEMGFAYGMSADARDVDAQIARRAAVFRREALTRITPLEAGACVISAPGWRR